MSYEMPSDKLLVTTLRAIGDGVMSCDQQGRVVLMNPVAEELTGWTEGEARGRNLREVFVIVNETTREAVEDPVDKVLRLGRIVGLANHTLLLRRDGTELAIDDSAAPVQDEDGGLRGVVMVFRDVTERRRAEWNVEMLAESGRVLGQARELDIILERISIVVSTHFADFCIFDLLQGSGSTKRVAGRHRLPECQPLADQMAAFQLRPAASGHPVTQVLGTRKAQLLAEPTEHVLEQMTSSPEHRAFYEQELKAKSILSVPLMAGDELLGVLTCVRHKRAAQFDRLDVIAAEELGQRLGLAMHYAEIRNDLRMEQARLNAIMAAVPVGILLAEPSGKILSANQEAERIFRHEIRYSQDIEAHAEYVSYHADGRQVQGHEYPLPRAIAEDRIIRDERFLYQKGDGSLGWVSFSAAPVKDETGYIWGGVVAFSDIDQLVRAQEVAERSEKRLQVMMEFASVGIAIVGFHGQVSYANQTLLDWLGYTKEEIQMGEVRWDTMTPREFAERDREAFRELYASRQVRPYEKVYIGKDGTPVPLLIGAALIPNVRADQEDDIAVFYTDLRTQKRAEEALLQTEKLTAVGRLASSISHEINNPLEAVTNLLYIVKGSQNLSQTDRDYLDAADRELGRVSQITTQTLRFHRQSTAAAKVKPEKLFEEVLLLYGTRLASSSVSIERDFSTGVSLMCFEGDIRQVLSNLVANAFDAMRQGGVLTLRTRCRPDWKTGAKGVMLTIADTGSGMTEEVRKRVFDAFYSTKGVHGTGLGLWISKRIVHKHRGHLKVRSTTGQRHGTVFLLWLPLELSETASESWHVDVAGT